MTEQVKQEIIKAFAYGRTPEEAAAAMGLTLEECNLIRQNNFPEIEERKKQLQEDGWFE